MSYFKFVRWLLFLNIFLMFIMFFVITVPFLALEPGHIEETINVNQSSLHGQAINCTHNYVNYHKLLLDKESAFEKVLDFLQGTVRSEILSL